MEKNIDIRILKLNKRYVPKTFILNEQKGYIAVGYFDVVEYQGVQVNPKENNPFMNGYEKMADWKNEYKHELIDYSSQEQMLFANICEKNEENGTGFTKQTINDFWKDKSFPYLFLSMIHINHIGNLGKVLHKIKEIFGENYLSYISFDYCDVIVFAKKLYMKEFLDKTKMLFQKELNVQKGIIFDTFSLVSFDPEWLKVNMEQLEKWTEENGGQGIDEFQANINLSVRDYEGFKKWFKGVNENPGIKPYSMFGRHDISIVNNNANTKWLLSIMDELHKTESQKLFWTFETYIKVEEKYEAQITTESQSETTDISGCEAAGTSENEITEKYYKKVESELGKNIDALIAAVEGAGLKNKLNYIMPVCEVWDCICSIVKNNFAEEFIYCIYESFKHFILYMTKKINQLKEEGKSATISEEKIAQSYDEYFTALNTLVNSTMHSERQFIQATAFNAIFYSVPPKIMAFYNAYIYQVKQILEDGEGKEKYTYLICPSFSPIISVDRISLWDKPPCDRILTVKINESALYDIKTVTHILIHELAHNTGNVIRCRKIRKKKIVNALLERILTQCEINDTLTIDVLNSYLYENYINKGEGDYLQELKEKGIELLDLLRNDSDGKLKGAFGRYYSEENTDRNCHNDEILGMLGIENTESQKAYKNVFSEQYSNQMYKIFQDKFREMNSHDNIVRYKKLINLLESVYEECYADLQMILVLAVTPEDYLNMVIRKHNVSPEALLYNEEDIIRFGLVFKTMFDCDIWNMSMFQDACLKDMAELMVQHCDQAFENVAKSERKQSSATINGMKDFIESYKKEVGEKKEGIIGNQNGKPLSFDKNKINEEKIPLKVYAWIIYGLYDYLINVTKVTLEEYQKEEKKGKIRKIRQVVKTVLDFEDAIKVFDCIETELNNYQKALFEDE